MGGPFDGEGQLAISKWQMANGKWQMAKSGSDSWFAVCNLHFAIPEPPL
jgi:hypothetical protein